MQDIGPEAWLNGSVAGLGRENRQLNLIIAYNLGKSRGYMPNNTT